MDSAPPKACIISSLMASKSSSVMPMRRIISFTWGSPRSLAHFKQRPSLTVFPFSSFEMNTTATRFLHLLQRVGCISITSGTGQWDRPVNGLKDFRIRYTKSEACWYEQIENF